MASTLGFSSVSGCVTSVMCVMLKSDSMCDMCDTQRGQSERRVMRGRQGCKAGEHTTHSTQKASLLSVPEQHIHTTHSHVCKHNTQLRHALSTCIVHLPACTTHLLKHCYILADVAARNNAAATTQACGRKRERERERGGQQQRKRTNAKSRWDSTRQEGKS